MFEPNPHFLFAQTFFGQADEIERVEEGISWTLLVQQNIGSHFQQKTGVFLHWCD